MTRRPTQEADLPGLATPLTPGRDTIEARRLSKVFKVARLPRGSWASVRGLFRREYRTVVAVDDVSFNIARGELVGYLGPNGAGKSTTIKMLTGILYPSSGTATVSGRVPWRERRAHVRRIGVVFGQRTNLWWDLPVRESFDLLRHIYSIPVGRYKGNLDRFDDLLELGAFLDSPVRSLSLGQRMRADLAAAMLHDPDVVFLDEPTIGLDVVAKSRIRSFIQAQNRDRGMTVLLTTHDLGDVEKLCRRVLMIDQGRLVFDGSLQSLHHRFGGEREIVVDLADDYDDLTIPLARLLRSEGRRAVYSFDRAAVSAADVISALVSRFRIVDLAVKEPDVEATIRRIYEERLLTDASRGEDEGGQA